MHPAINQAAALIQQPPRGRRDACSSACGAPLAEIATASIKAAHLHLLQVL